MKKIPTPVKKPKTSAKVIPIPKPKPKRHITDEGIQLIKRFEGFASEPYICPAGVRTIGYGHAIKKGESFTGCISEEEALELLRQDVQEAEQAVAKYIEVALTDGQFNALVSFTYNLGAGALQRSTLRRKINRGEHADVPDELARWVFAGGRKLPGLVKRREAEAKMYMS